MMVIIMGQAKRRGTLEERSFAASIIRAEKEAWEEYYTRENMRYQKWLWNSLTKEEQILINNIEISRKRAWETLLSSFPIFNRR